MTEPVHSPPRHVAIIMDGNGRWARQRGWPRLKGHEAGAESVRRVLRCCRQHGVQYLTLYAFSTENWTRPQAEVAGLMELLRHFLETNEGELHANRVRLRVIGRRTDLPPDVDAAIASVEKSTRTYEAGQLLLALSYGGRGEIVDAVRRIAAAAMRGELDPACMDEHTVAEHLYAPDVPDPDLIIRTSGELRLSNFLIWQAAYSEFHVTPVLWPDFGEADFQLALEAYARRTRRYGGVDPVVEEAVPC